MIVTSSLFPIRVELAVWWKSLTVFTGETDTQTHNRHTEKDTNRCHRHCTPSPAAQPAGLGLILQAAVPVGGASGSSTRAHRWWWEVWCRHQPAAGEETPNTQCTGELGRAPQSDTGNTKERHKNTRNTNTNTRNAAGRRHQTLNALVSLGELPSQIQETPKNTRNTNTRNTAGRDTKNSMHWGA